MDPVLSGWILEFIIREPIEDRLVNSLLTVLPLPDNPLLKKTILLRRILSEISTGFVSERTMESLEMIEELDSREGEAVLDSMKAAYCAVAVDCSVRFLREKVNGYNHFLDAVEKIWRRRIHQMEVWGNVGLVSERLKDWRQEIEAATWNEIVREKLLTKDTCGDALKLVRDYLEEAREAMGPSFLEFSAEMINAGKEEVPILDHPSTENRVGDEVVGLVDLHKGLNSDDGFASGDNCSNMPVDSSANNHEEILQSSKLGFSHPSTDYRVGDEVVGLLDLPKELNNDNRVASGDNCSDILVYSAANNHKEILQLSKLGLDHPSTDNRVGDEVVGLVELPKGLNNDKRVASGDNCSNMLVDSAVNNHKEILQSSKLSLDHPSTDNRVGDKVLDLVDLPKELNNDERVASGDNCSNMLVDSAANNNEEILPELEKIGEGMTAKVNRVQEALNVSSMELRELVKDPLPEALNFASRVISGFVYKKRNIEPLKENQNVMDLESCLDEGVRAIEAKEEVCGDSHLQQKDVQRPSLMEQDNAAFFFEYNSSECSTRYHLPSPKKRPHVSPLKKLDLTKFGRRRRKKWSTLEEETLSTGVEKYGKGNWKLILNSYRYIFDERTEVDLKDKWRNMVK